MPALTLPVMRSAVPRLSQNANSVVIDCAIKESESLAKSNNMMDELIDAGSNVMASLTSQGDMLKVCRRCTFPRGVAPQYGLVAAL